MDYTKVFLSDLVIQLPENIGINEHILKLVEDKQSPHGSIYTLSWVDLKTLKTYIKTHLKIKFIRSSKSLIGIYILFDKKPNGNLYLCIDYQGLNNLTIKNWYPPTLIGKFLNWLGGAKQFT